MNKTYEFFIKRYFENSAQFLAWDRKFKPNYHRVPIKEMVDGVSGYRLIVYREPGIRQSLGDKPASVWLGDDGSSIAGWYHMDCLHRGPGLPAQVRTAANGQTWCQFWTQGRQVMGPQGNLAQQLFIEECCSADMTRFAAWTEFMGHRVNAYVRGDVHVYEIVGDDGYLASYQNMASYCQVSPLGAKLVWLSHFGTPHRPTADGPAIIEIGPDGRREEHYWNEGIPRPKAASRAAPAAAQWGASPV